MENILEIQESVLKLHGQAATLQCYAQAHESGEAGGVILGATEAIVQEIEKLRDSIQKIVD